MSAARFDSVRISLSQSVSILIADNSIEDADNVVSHPDLPSAWMGKAGGFAALLKYESGAESRGIHSLQLFELKTYYWELFILDGDNIDDFSVGSSLQGTAREKEWHQKKSRHGTFKFVNYLGSAWIEVSHHGVAYAKVRFDVITNKIDFETEYRSMVESIAEECQQLLLEWGSPTALNIVSNPEKQAQVLLEQFLFLRHMLGPERLELYLETLRRNPHTRLEKERDWKPSASAHPGLFIKDPLRYGRDWQRAGSGGSMVAGFNAGEILEERKFDSLDTPPNQFVKFALENFRSLCDQVMEALQEEQGTAYCEAASMRDALDSFLTSAFFDDVGELQRVPFESQTLQKREGYREILNAWLMLDAAAQIDWPGRKDAYDGTNRDVATLYEYWLYFVLVHAFQKDLNMKAETNPLQKDAGAKPFCCDADDGRLVINLKQHEESFVRFLWSKGDQQLRIHFFYNRRFVTENDLHKRGSYSKGLRPDYSMVIIPVELDDPDWELAEERAESAGKIAYLHFDAKYRVEKFQEIFGEGEDESDTERSETKATGTFKRADLYKMHTYTEAIRRTVGSYVLYPGDDPANALKKNRFERYREIVPGIGAFAIKPKSVAEGGGSIGMKFLCEFIEDLLEHQLNNFTQSYRINYCTEQTVRDTPAQFLREDAVPETIGSPGATVILGYMKKEMMESFRTNLNFYCRATDDDGVPLDLDIAAAQGALLLGWSSAQTGPVKTINWTAQIASCRLVNRETLISETGYQPSSGSVHYLLFKLTDISKFDPRDITTLIKEKNQEGHGGKYRTLQVKMEEVLKIRPINAATKTDIRY
ncbi:MAG: hypothetical protein JWM68_1837 [Verrucomicrobiales bacterium]|nr:hypothetical protein [Verrucomicrobiales bacterium]